MSTHLLIAAAYIENLPQATKLILMAVADSADEHTLESAPGLPKLRAWSGLGKSRALEVMGQLVTAGWLERVEAGGRGRRAVFRVFPKGVPAIPHPKEVAARYELGSGAADPNEISPSVDNPETIHNPGSGPADPGDTVRVRSGGNRVRPTGPLQSSTSCKTAATAIPSAPTVDSGRRNPVPPSPSRPSVTTPRRKDDPKTVAAGVAEAKALISRRRRAQQLTTRPTTKETRSA